MHLVWLGNQFFYAVLSAQQSNLRGFRSLCENRRSPYHSFPSTVCAAPSRAICRSYSWSSGSTADVRWVHWLHEGTYLKTGGTASISESLLFRSLTNPLPCVSNCNNSWWPHFLSVGAPKIARGHGLTLLRKSGLHGVLNTCLLVGRGQHYIYGDAAYVLCLYFQTTFFAAGSTAEQRASHKEMSMFKVSMEGSYKGLKQMWTRSDYYLNPLLQNFPAGLIYIPSALLLNFKMFVVFASSANCAKYWVT